MSILGEDDILKVKLARVINGKLTVEHLDITYSDVQWMNTPQLLRHFSACIESAKNRLDFVEEYSQPKDNPS